MSVLSNSQRHVEDHLANVREYIVNFRQHRETTLGHYPGFLYLFLPYRIKDKMHNKGNLRKETKDSIQYIVRQKDVEQRFPYKRYHHSDDVAG